MNNFSHSQVVSDLIILGAGAAGLAASIYATYYRLNHLVIGESIGGTTLEAAKIENYPGFRSISGKDLMDAFRKHAEGLGGKIIQGTAVSIKREDNIFEVNIHHQFYHAKTLLIAFGTRRRRLNIPGEEKFLGKGVSYCATCDALFFKNKTVAVVGGADSAASAAILLADHAQKVYLIYRGSELRSQPLLTDQIKKNPKIEIIYNTNVLEIRGTNKVERIILDKAFKANNEVALDGIFIEIGAIPSTDLAKQIGIATDPQGYIIVDEWGATNVSGIYAAGDITTKTPGFNQIITAAADGAAAISAIYRYLKEMRK